MATPATVTRQCHSHSHIDYHFRASAQADVLNGSKASYQSLHLSPPKCQITARLSSKDLRLYPSIISSVFVQTYTRYGRLAITHARTREEMLNQSNETFKITLNMLRSNPVRIATFPQHTDIIRKHQSSSEIRNATKIIL